MGEAVAPGKRAAGGHEKAVGLRQELGQGQRQCGQCAETAIDEEDRLEARAQARVVVEQTRHVAERRAAQVPEGQAREPPQPAPLEVVRQRRRDVGQNVVRHRVVREAADTHVLAQVAPQRASIASSEMGSPSPLTHSDEGGRAGAAVVGIDRYQPGVTGRERDGGAGRR